MRATWLALMGLMLVMGRVSAGRKLSQNSPSAIPSPIPSLIAMLGQGGAEGVLYISAPGTKPFH